MMYVMRTWGSLTHPEAAGMYLRNYDPEAHDGRGQVDWTDDPAHAMPFANPMDGFALWNTQSKVHPIRLTDGKPNKPLTAFTIEMIPRPERGSGGSTGDN